MAGSISDILVFGWFEYVVFFGMLGASVLIGIYYGCIKSGQDTVAEYMLGGKRMPIFPIAMSLIASFISGITLLGIPSETYVYGTQLYAINVAIVIAAVLLNIFYLPVIYKLESTSIFEYLERRFNHTVRSLGSLMYTLSLFLYIPVVIYVPSLAFNQVTGMSMYVLAPIICAVCIFYTSLGGLKAVVWSDALQSMFTLASVLAVAVLGLISVGGVANVYNKSVEGERLELLNMDFDPFKRTTFPAVVFGSVVTWMAFFAVHPGTYQRFAALPTFRHTRLVTVYMCFGLVFVKSIMTFVGLIMYTKYHDCDPVITKEIQKAGQVLPYYVMDVARDYPGLSGLFLSGVVSTALSTMSTGLNTVAMTLFEDFIKPHLPWEISEKSSNLVMKIVVVILGCISTAMVFIVEKLGPIMQVAITLNGVTTGISLYLFTLGMFIPWANSKGAICGTLAAFVSTSWLAIGAQLAILRGDLKFPGKVTSIINCPENSTLHLNLNQTVFGNPGYGSIVEADEDLPMLYRISYLYFSIIGFLVGLLVAMIVSLLTGRQEISELSSDLVIPQLRWLFTDEEKKKKKSEPQIYSLVPLNEAIPDN
ncbi:sodium-coupled monocarboxylate transporter 1-like [Cimex lectularius]|uniref:Sodium/solute symporter n=1 Tax=Cimex lectularius TaxID=79782 RepID=A0A8I6S641_CIMLE|nr:sodium-coupled monocarboxylate transporter 1-like [Cimex lectularius]